jgi:RNA polymerase sigma factor (sigma-70 family)
MNYTDEQLISDICGGNQQKRDTALHYFVSNPALRHWASRYVSEKGGSPDDVKDVFIESLAIFDRDIREGKFRGESSLQTFFHAIFKWKWTSFRRKFYKTLPANMPAPEKEKESPEFDFLKEEQQSLMNAAIARLDERCQQLLQLYKLDYSMKELVEELGITNVNMAKKQAAKCREKLRDILLGDPALLAAFNIRIPDA